MVRVIIIPEAQDTRNQVNMLIALSKTAGAAVIMSQCLHTRKEGVEDGTDEGAIRCPDCGATGKPDAKEGADDGIASVCRDDCGGGAADVPDVPTAVETT